LEVVLSKIQQAVVDGWWLLGFIKDLGSRPEKNAGKKHATSTHIHPPLRGH
jgi:hypothetical protein